MYQTILVTLDATATDRKILDHVKPLAASFKSRLILLHVAMGGQRGRTARMRYRARSMRTRHTWRR